MCTNWMQVYQLAIDTILFYDIPVLTLEGDLGEEVTLWPLTSLCTSAKREVEVAL